jgi:hypothetical protein
MCESSFHWNKSHALSIKISVSCFLKIRDDNKERKALCYFTINRIRLE